MVAGKQVTLLDGTTAFVAGTKVQCKLKDGEYTATILTMGMRCILDAHVLLRVVLLT